MEKVKLDFAVTLKDAVTVGIKNAPSILGCVVLWLLTVWIPWINVGTTIAVFYALPLELSKGKIISPLTIFDAEYRKYFGEVFMTMGLMYIPILLATFFMIIPGIVLNIAWSLAVLLVLDKKMNPSQAISASNEATYGSKWAIFGVMFVIGIASWLVIFLINLLFGLLAYATGLGFIMVLGTLIVICIFVIVISFTLSANGSIYRQLKDNVK